MPKLTSSQSIFDLVQELENNIPGLNKKEYVEILEWIFGKLEVSKFAYVHMDSSPFESSDIAIHSNHPAEWVETYRKTALYKSDPVMVNSAVTSNPFFWNEIPDESNGEIFEQSQEYGIQ